MTAQCAPPSVEQPNTQSVVLPLQASEFADAQVHGGALSAASDAGVHETATGPHGTPLYR
jgi:hypothetical protein